MNSTLESPASCLPPRQASAHLRPLPLFVPEVYALHHRLVDVEGYVSLHGHRYSVPYQLIGRQSRAVREDERSDRPHQGPRLV